MLFVTGRGKHGFKRVVVRALRHNQHEAGRTKLTCRRASRTFDIADLQPIIRVLWWRVCQPSATPLELPVVIDYSSAKFEIDRVVGLGWPVAVFRRLVQLTHPLAIPILVERLITPSCSTLSVIEDPKRDCSLSIPRRK
jgi:hypothetical protein